ncbi:MAG: biopolymer transport protein ExbB [Candidatus Sumerlaeota bacterium]|nr:biopolymer transport protein ExbB [Candidatus Sumerlaeota bacterium]
MMVFLVPLALLAIAFIVQGFINLRRARLAPANFLRRLPALLDQCRTQQDIETMLEREGHSLALVLRRVLRHLEFKADADPADILAESIEEECNALQQRNSQLALVYNVAPLMGLLGTVFGMLNTFREFASSADPSVRQLSVGINVALLTTAWGLAIAIPAFIFLYLFTRRISNYEQVRFPAEGGEALELLLRAIRFESRASVSAKHRVAPASEPPPAAATTETPPDPDSGAGFT